MLGAAAVPSAKRPVPPITLIATPPPLPKTDGSDPNDMVVWVIRLGTQKRGSLHP